MIEIVRDDKCMNLTRPETLKGLKMVQTKEPKNIFTLAKPPYGTCSLLVSIAPANRIIRPSKERESHFHCDLFHQRIE